MRHLSKSASLFGIGAFILLTVRLGNTVPAARGLEIATSAVADRLKRGWGR